MKNQPKLTPEVMSHMYDIFKENPCLLYFSGTDEERDVLWDKIVYDRPQLKKTTG